MSSYQHAWSQFRRWRWVGFAALATMIASVGAFFAMAPRGVVASWMWLVNVLAPFLGLTWMYCAVRMELFKCPRCGDLFFRHSLWTGGLPFRRQCIHCDLKLFDKA
jgi:hypothetical protein